MVFSIGREQTYEYNNNKDRKNVEGDLETKMENKYKVSSKISLSINKSSQVIPSNTKYPLYCFGSNDTAIT